MCYFSTRQPAKQSKINYNRLKYQPDKGELAGKNVDELRIRLIRDEQATVSCPLVTGERSHQNRPAFTASANDNEEHFSQDMLIVHHACKTNAVCGILLLINYYYH